MLASEGEAATTTLPMCVLSSQRRLAAQRLLHRDARQPRWWIWELLQSMLTQHRRNLQLLQRQKANFGTAKSRCAAQPDRRGRGEDPAEFQRQLQ